MKETIRDLYIIYIYARLRMIHVCYKNSSSFDSSRLFLVGFCKIGFFKKIFSICPVLRHSFSITKFVDAKSRENIGNNLVRF